MITCINPRGGLGNQMFQIAAAYAHMRDHNTKLELRYTKDPDEKRPRYWHSILKNCEKYCVNNLGVASIWSQPGNGVTTFYHIPARSVLLNGLFQSCKYFVHYKNEIRNLFTPDKNTQALLKYKYGALINRENVVVVHARRGDYLDLSHIFNILTPSYYLTAFEHIEKSGVDYHYLLVCEDSDFWGTFLDVSNTKKYTVLKEKDECVTMALMWQFKNFIIANSSYSWWGAWLSDADIVYAPRHWFNTYGPQAWEDIYDPSWIIL